jgi:hypothetical protein
MMKDHEEHLKELKGLINLRVPDYKRLKGWDFLDLVSNKSSLTRLVHTLESSGGNLGKTHTTH